MNWLRKLIGRPADKTAQRPPQVQAAAAKVAPVIDLSALRQAIAAAADDSQRAAAARELGRALGTTRQRPAADDDLAVWVAAVAHASDKTQALEWIAGLTDESGLAEIAVDSRSGEVRLTAAKRLSDAALLERVANANRDKDKRVFRHCSELLRERREAASRSKRLVELTRAVRELQELTPLPGSRLPALQQEWRALSKGETDEAECAALLHQAQQRFTDEMQSLRALHGQRAEAESLRDEIAGAHLPSMNKLEAWAVRSGVLEAALAQCPAWLAEHADGRALHQALQEIEATLAVHAEDVRRTVACERFLEGLTAEAAIDADAIAAWEALPKPGADSVLGELQARWHALQKQAPVIEPAQPAPSVSREVPSAAPPAVAIDHTAVRALLDAIEQHLEQGQLADAEKLDKQIEQAANGSVLPGSLDRRWRRARGQIARLRGWARWGTDQVREHLIADAEQLLRSEPDVDERARLVPALRQEWKRLNAHGSGSKNQWERFDAALTQAYQPVVEHRAEEAVRHQAARAAKEALCSEWEAWLDGVVWEHADSKVVEAQRQAMLTQWRAAATAGFRDDRALRKRLDAVLARIEDKLSAVRQAELARREQLIASAEQLRDSDHMANAINETKALQGRWRAEAASVRLSRAEEQALWQRFRGACDAVFARRDAHKAENAALREQQEQARLEQIRDFEAVVQGTDANALQQALAPFRAIWGDGRASRSAGELEHRARELLQQAEQRIAWLRNEKYRSRFELMAQKAALAQRVEAAAAAALPLDAIAEEARNAWSSLTALPHKTEQLLAQRLTAAATATPATLAAGHQARGEKLLDLEIALGMPSPAAYADARRTRQLAQLQKRFGATPGEVQHPDLLVAHCYAIAATPDAEQEARLDNIICHLSSSASSGPAT